ncbi:hypothetical protein [Aeromicrobium sp.]|uniref:hypothetical protein n=1 Tax=Aeromicrobium sp. TaxID=1871063 RepID=UPI0025C422F5|nr:hypothetical protein [Aeromicrobium sp.]
MPYVWSMQTRIDLTLDCTNPHLMAAFWKTAAGYVDHDEFDDGMDAVWLHDPWGEANAILRAASIRGRARLPQRLIMDSATL